MKRLVVIVTLAAAIAVQSTPATATADFTLTRVAGADRFATAAAVARETSAAAPHVVIATGRSASDALAGAHLAVPLLLTEVTSVPASTRDALDALGTERVTLLGGPAAIGPAVEAELTAAGYGVTRIAGGDRYETAAAVAAAGPGAAEIENVPTAIIASGDRVSDAIAAGPLAARGLPILLTGRDELPASTAAALDDLAIGRALVLGGTASVGDGVAAALAARDIQVVRLAGADRTATATAVADWAIDALDFGVQRVTLARGDAFADALAGGPYGGESGTVTLLTTSATTLGDATAAWLRAHTADLASGSVLGGPGAVSDAVVAQATAAGRGQSTSTSTGAGGGALTIAITGGLADGAYTADTTPTWTGTASAGAGAVERIEASVDRATPSATGTSCTGCGTGDATWSYTSPVLANGPHSVALAAVSGGARSQPATAQVIVDTVKPEVSKASGARGSDVVNVGFTEPVLCSSAAASAFHATVDGATSTVRRVTCAATSAATVAVTIGAAVNAGQTVKVSVDPTVTDRAGNQLGTTRSATATIGDADAPVLTVTSGPKDQGFTNRDQPNWLGDATSGRTVTRVEVSANGGTFSTASTFCTGCPGTTVQWRYHPPARQAEGSYTVAFRAVDADGVRSAVATRRYTVDLTKPTVGALSATAEKATVDLAFSEPMLCSSVTASDFTATIASTAVAVNAVACSADAGASIGITLARAPRDGESVAVKPVSAHAVTDRAGNPLSFAAEAMATAKAVDTTPPTFDSISFGTVPDTINAMFSESIATCPSESFRVTVNASAVPVTASCGSSSVQLKLPSGTVLQAGQEVTVTVTGPVADGAGNQAATGVSHTKQV